MQHSELASSVDFEDRSIAQRPTIKSGSIDVSSRIQDQSRYRILTVRRSSEAVQQGEFARPVKFEDRSKATRRAAVFSGAVAVARGVSDQTCIRIFAVRCPREAVEQSEFAGFIEFENGSKATRRAAVDGGSVEVANRVSDQTRLRIFSVRRSGKAVPHSFFPLRVELEYGSVAARGSAVASRAIAVAVRIANQSAIRIGTVGI